MKLSIVDVFAEDQYAGNQLAVVHDAASLSEQAMQDIAREMNFSETTFVLGQSNGRARVRIFTPEWELPFAGHPTVGTAWVLAKGKGSIVLDLPIGEVGVSFDDAGIGWMTPPPVALNAQFDPERAAALIGLSSDDLAADYPPQFAEVGPQFILIGVKELRSLQQAKLDEALYNAYKAEGLGVQCVFVFSPEPYEPSADFSSRMFFHSGNIREDPATGSANTAFAAYLLAHRGALGDVVVDQGVEIKRPSRLYLRVGEPIQVGGRVVQTVAGELC
ncbi:MAG: PhzF family phenazine biosynthesis protein [Pseudomonadales bacterium]